jgi:hypothetical protein
MMQGVGFSGVMLVNRDRGAPLAAASSGGWLIGLTSKWAEMWKPVPTC